MSDALELTPTDGPIRVSRIPPAGWRLLREVRLRSLRDSPGAFLGTAAEEERLGAADWRRRCDDSLWAVAGFDGTPAGLANLARSHDPGEAMHVEGLWVAPGLRRKGIATRLTRFLEDAARDLGEPVLGLWVFDNNPRARAFYERLGYAPSQPPRRQRLRDVPLFSADERIEEELRKPLTARRITQSGSAAPPARER